MQKHGVSFREASECFFDPLAVVLQEPRHPDREILIGVSRRQKLIFTVYIQRDVAVVRILSARKAAPHERELYEEGD
jgi:hypothetical protein